MKITYTSPEGKKYFMDCTNEILYSSGEKIDLKTKIKEDFNTNFKEKEEEKC